MVQEDVFVDKGSASSAFGIPPTSGTARHCVPHSARKRLRQTCSSPLVDENRTCSTLSARGMFTHNPVRSARQNDCWRRLSRIWHRPTASVIVRINGSQASFETMFSDSIARSSPLSHDDIKYFVHRRTLTNTAVGGRLRGDSNVAPHLCCTPACTPLLSLIYSPSADKGHSRCHDCLKSLDDRCPNGTSGPT